MNLSTRQNDARRVSRHQDRTHSRSNMSARVLARMIATTGPAWAKARALHVVSEQSQDVFFQVLRDQRAMRSVPRKMPGEADAAYIRRLHTSGWLRQSAELTAISTN